MKYEKNKNKIKKLWVQKPIKDSKIERLKHIPSPYNSISINLNKTQEYETGWSTIPQDPSVWNPVMDYENIKDVSGRIINYKYYIEFDNLPESFLPFVDVSLLFKTVQKDEKVVPIQVHKGKKVINYYKIFTPPFYNVKGDPRNYYKIFGDDISLYEGVGFYEKFYGYGDESSQQNPVSLNDICNPFLPIWFPGAISKYPIISPYTWFYWSKYTKTLPGHGDALWSHWDSGYNWRLGYCYSSFDGLFYELITPLPTAFVPIADPIPAPPYSEIRVEMNNPYPIYFVQDGAYNNEGNIQGDIIYRRDFERVRGTKIWVKMGENKYRLYMKTDICIEGNGQYTTDKLTYIKVIWRYTPVYSETPGVQHGWTYQLSGKSTERNLSIGSYTPPKNPFEMKAIVSFKNLRKYHEIRNFKKKT